MNKSFRTMSHDLTRNARQGADSTTVVRLVRDRAAGSPRVELALSALASFNWFKEWLGVTLSVLRQIGRAHV